EEAFAMIGRSVELLEELVASQPDQPLYHAELGRALHIRGFLYDEARDNGRAMEALEWALREVEQAVRDAPKTENFRFSLAEILWNLGEQFVDLGQVDKGLPHYRRAVEICRQLLADHPGDKYWILLLAERLERLAAVERSGGDSEAALRSFTEAVDVLEPLAGEADTEVQVRRGAMQMGAGLAAADLGRTVDALSRLRQ